MLLQWKADRMYRFITDKNTTKEQSFVGSFAAGSVIGVPDIQDIIWTYSSCFIFHNNNRCLSMSE